MDLLLAILISMGLNVTPQDLSNKDYVNKHLTEIQQAQTIIANQHVESIKHKRFTSTPIRK
jgi:hypothetical protein